MATPGPACGYQSRWHSTFKPEPKVKLLNGIT